MTHPYCTTVFCGVLNYRWPCHLKNVDGYIYTRCRMFSVYTLVRSLPVRQSTCVSEEATTWPALRSHVKSPVVAFVKLIDPQCAMSFRKTVGIYLPRFSARTALPRTFKPRKMYTREFLAFMRELCLHLTTRLRSHRAPCIFDSFRAFPSWRTESKPVLNSWNRKPYQIQMIPFRNGKYASRIRSSKLRYNRLSWSVSVSRCKFIYLHPWSLHYHTSTCIVSHVLIMQSLSRLAECSTEDTHRVRGRLRKNQRP